MPRAGPGRPASGRRARAARAPSRSRATATSICATRRRMSSVPTSSASGAIRAPTGGASTSQASRSAISGTAALAEADQHLALLVDELAAKARPPAVGPGRARRAARASLPASRRRCARTHRRRRGPWPRAARRARGAAASSRRRSRNDGSARRHAAPMRAAPRRLPPRRGGAGGACAGSGPIRRAMRRRTNTALPSTCATPRPSWSSDSISAVSTAAACFKRGIQAASYWRQCGSGRSASHARARAVSAAYSAGCEPPAHQLEAQPDQVGVEDVRLAVGADLGDAAGLPEFEHLVAAHAELARQAEQERHVLEAHASARPGRPTGRP